MTCRLIFVFLCIGLASMQAKAAVFLPPVLDVQARTALTCDRGPVSCGCGLDCRIPTSVSPVITPACGCGLPTCASCGIPTAAYRAPVAVPAVNACGCAVSVPAALTTPLLPPLPPVLGCTKYLRQVTVPMFKSVNACGCAVPVPAALTAPLVPPLPPVLGCTKYLRRVCVRPPFL